MTLHNSKIKIRDCSEDQIAEITKAFNKMIMHAGVNQPLEDWAVVDLIRFIRAEFKDFSFSEIAEAFKKFNANKLDFKDGAFQNFSQNFLGEVLTSYRSYRNKILFKYHKELEKMMEQKEPTQEEKDQIEQEFLNECLYKPYQKAVENGSYLRFENKTGASLFVKFHSNGFFSVSDEEKSKYGIKAKQALKNSLKSKITGVNQKSIKKLIDALDLQEEGSAEERQVKECAARLFFEDWINKQIELKTDLKLIKL